MIGRHLKNKHDRRVEAIIVGACADPRWVEAVFLRRGSSRTDRGVIAIRYCVTDWEWLS